MCALCSHILFPGPNHCLLLDFLMSNWFAIKSCLQSILMVRCFLCMPIYACALSLLGASWNEVTSTEHWGSPKWGGVFWCAVLVGSCSHCNTDHNKTAWWEGTFFHLLPYFWAVFPEKSLQYLYLLTRTCITTLALQGVASLFACLVTHLCKQTLYTLYTHRSWLEGRAQSLPCTLPVCFSQCYSLPGCASPWLVSTLQYHLQ